MSNNKSEMSDRGFLVLTMALGAAVVWLRYKFQILTFIVNWRIAVALLVTLGMLIGLIFVRNKLRNKIKER